MSSEIKVGLRIANRIDRTLEEQKEGFSPMDLQALKSRLKIPGQTLVPQESLECTLPDTGDQLLTIDKLDRQERLDKNPAGRCRP